MEWQEIKIKSHIYSEKKKYCQRDLDRLSEIVSIWMYNIMIYFRNNCYVSMLDDPLDTTVFLYFFYSILNHNKDQNQCLQHIYITQPRSNKIYIPTYNS